MNDICYKFHNIGLRYYYYSGAFMSALTGQGLALFVNIVIRQDCLLVTNALAYYSMKANISVLHYKHDYQSKGALQIEAYLYDR